MRSKIMIGLICLSLPICGRAFELYGVRVGMSLEEVKSTLPKKWRIKQLLKGVGAYVVDDRRTGKVPDLRIYWFCTDYDQLAAVENQLSFNENFAQISKRYIAEFGKPTDVTVKPDLLSPDEFEKVSLEWTQGQETLSISASIVKKPKRGHEMPTAVIALQGLSKCHSEYWERKDRPAIMQNPFRLHAG